MSRFYLSCLIFSGFFSTCLVAQAPQKFSYQAVARDAEGKYLPEKQIGVDIQIRQGTPAGTLVFREKHTGMQTNKFGLFILEIGSGIPQTGSIQAIDWENGPFYLQVGIDPAGGSNYSLQSASPLLSVPYALYAAQAPELDGDPTNELQMLQLNGNDLSISGGNTVTLPTGTGTSQVLAAAPVTGDGSAANPITLGQNGAAPGQVLKWNGAAWTPADDDHTVYTAGPGITLTGDQISATDPSPANELQDLELSGNTLTLTDDPTPVNLSPFLQTLQYDPLTQLLSISGGNTVQLDGGAGDLYWNQVGLNLQTISAVPVVLPGNKLRAANNSFVFDNERLTMLAANGKTRVFLCNDDWINGSGSVHVYNVNGEKASTITGCDHGVGYFDVRDGASGSKVVVVSHAAADRPEDGDLSIYSKGVSVAGFYAENGSSRLDLFGNGRLSIYNPNDKAVDLRAENGAGKFSLFKSANKPLVLAGESNVVANTGSVAVYGSGGVQAGILDACGHATGYFELKTGSGDQVINMNHYGNQPANGEINVHANGTPVVILNAADGKGHVYTDELYSGSMVLNTPTQWLFDFHATTGNRGEMFLYPLGGGSPIVTIRENNVGEGVVEADNIVAYGVKNFRVTHPANPAREIWYASVEGPEAAAYERGVAQLTNGEAFVSYSEHFGALINPETITVQLTAQYWDTFGLAVVEKTPLGFRVKELKGGTGHFKFDWEAKGVRKGYENYQPVRDKTPAPEAPPPPPVRNTQVKRH